MKAEAILKEIKKNRKGNEGKQPVQKQQIKKTNEKAGGKRE